MLIKSKTALIRVDANFLIGSGHAMRMLALSEMIGSKFNLHVAYRDLPENLIKSFETIGATLMPLHNISQQNELKFLFSKIKSIDLIIIDGYEELDDFKKQSIESISKVLLVQDDKKITFEADLIINHSPFIQDTSVKKLPNRICFGLEYSILQDCFLEVARNPALFMRKKKGIFLNLGGSDPNDVTSKILKILIEETSENIRCVLGPMNRNIEGIKENFKEFQDRLEIFHSLSAIQMRDILISSKLGICPSSTIALEAIACRLPLITGWSVENQKDIYAGLDKLGLAKGIGNLEASLKKISINIHELTSNTDIRSDIITNQICHMDGNSSKRINESIQLLIS